MDNVSPYVMQNYMPIPESGCWIWMGGWDRHGYGKRSQHGYVSGGSVHRLFYQQHVGPIPAGAYVLHKCDTRPCCNPDHLFLGTHKDNMHDM